MGKTLDLVHFRLQCERSPFMEPNIVYTLATPLSFISILPCVQYLILYQLHVHDHDKNCMKGCLNPCKYSFTNLKAILAQIWCSGSEWADDRFKAFVISKIRGLDWRNVTSSTLYANTKSFYFVFILFVSFSKSLNSKYEPASLQIYTKKVVMGLYRLYRLNEQQPGKMSISYNISSIYFMPD